MRTIMILGVMLALAACTSEARQHRGCGLLGCLSSPYLQARGSERLIGQPVEQAIAALGGAPDSALDIGDTKRVLTWSRVQTDASVGTLSCTETLIEQDGRVTGYSAEGHCGR